MNRTRSWWGWGDEAAQLDGGEVRQLVDRVRLFVPGHDFTDHAPPAIGDLEVPGTRLTPPGSLSRLTSTDDAVRGSHAHGKAFRDVVRNLRGDLAHPPDVVAYPECERDVADVLDWCAGAGAAVVPYGGGSSVVGGVEPRFEQPSVSLDMSRMGEVVEIDPVSRSARIQAGAFGPAIEAQLRDHGLTLRHFPQSFEFSTLGGWLATRAGGHFATLYTHIDDLTEAIRVVTPVGTTASRRLPGSGAGPSPDRLFLGSEGTLGVITEAWMRLQDRPRWHATATSTFDSFGQAVAATRAIAQSGLYPSNCRLLDPAEALVSTGTAARGGMLILGFESADHPVDAWLARGTEIVEAHSGTVTSARVQDRSAPSGDRGRDGASSWRSAFLRMPYQRDALARRSMIAETFETACTWNRFDEVHHAVTTAAQQAVNRVCGSGLVTCRFTHVYPDGPAPYYGVYAPGRWNSLVAQWDEIKAAVSRAIVEGGGTITHHHAVGRDHRPWYDEQRPDVFADALRAAKTALDPVGILNPGVLLSERKA